MRELHAAVGDLTYIYFNLLSVARETKAPLNEKQQAWLDKLESIIDKYVTGLRPSVHAERDVLTVKLFQEMTADLCNRLEAAEASGGAGDADAIAHARMMLSLTSTPAEK